MPKGAVWGVEDVDGTAGVDDFDGAAGINHAGKGARWTVVVGLCFFE